MNDNCLKSNYLHIFLRKNNEVGDQFKVPQNDELCDYSVSSLLGQ
jgi:hypothetical protein